jgi:uncharacterized protein
MKHILRILVPAVLLSAALMAPGLATADARQDFFKAIAIDDVTSMRSAMLRGTSANARDGEGSPAVVVAAREKAWNALRALAELRGTDVEATDRLESTALMYAALHGELPAVQFLVSRGAEVNRPGWTALHYAAANGHVDVVRYLLERHAYLDAESPNRTTPLMMAARQGKPSMVDLLLEEGADPTIRNQSGLTAADYARGAGDERLASLLAERAMAFSRRHGIPAAR